MLQARLREPDESQTLTSTVPMCRDGADKTEKESVTAIETRNIADMITNVTGTMRAMTSQTIHPSKTIAAAAMIEVTGVTRTKIRTKTAIAARDTALAASAQTRNRSIES